VQAIPELFDPAVVEHPYPFYADLRRHGPVHRLPGTDFFLVSTWDAVQEATARVTDFSSNLTAALVHRVTPPRCSTWTPSARQATSLPPLTTPHHSDERKVVLPGLVAKRIRAHRLWLPSIMVRRHRRLQLTLA
jgi:cytochrome P450